MPAVTVPARIADPDLMDARESLAYWEHRARALPLHAVRRRREAREMADRWHHRVAAAEREAYGRGFAGALALVVAERRLPEPARRAGRDLARGATRLVVAVTVLVVALAAAAVGVALEVLLRLVDALA